MTDEQGKLKKEQRKESILESALEEFVNRGFDATTMRGIAKAEGISETLLYRFFKNKNDVLISILKSKANQTFEAMEEIIETTKGMIPNPEKTLVLILKLMKKRLEENHNLISLIQKEHQNIRKIIDLKLPFQKNDKLKFTGKRFLPFLQEMNIIENLTDYFQRCKEAGNLRKDLDPKHCALMFLRFLFMPIFSGPRPLTVLIPDLSDLDYDAFFKTQINIFLYGLVP